MTLLPALDLTVKKLTGEFNSIAPERKNVLHELTRFVQTKLNDEKKIYLNFICTHNSRRSHIAQLWTQAGSYYYSIPYVECFSGGTEATAFNPRAVKAMRDAGFNITVEAKSESNPIYHVRFAEDANPVVAFSKRYDDPFNHSQNFAAIMTCAQADENCPVVSGASARIAIRYDDPKEFDDTLQEGIKYEERVLQIGREMLYALSQIKS